MLYFFHLFHEFQIFQNTCVFNFMMYFFKCLSVLIKRIFKIKLQISQIGNRYRIKAALYNFNILTFYQMWRKFFFLEVFRTKGKQIFQRQLHKDVVIITELKRPLHGDRYSCLYSISQSITQIHPVVCTLVLT